MKKKFLMVALFALVCCVAFTFANTVSATTGGNTTNAGKVEDITSSNKIENDDDKVVTITYTKTELEKLKWDPANPEIGRTMNGWWIGFKVTAPDNGNYDKEKATFTRPNSDGTTTTKKFNDVVDTTNGNYCSYWFFIDQNTLNEKGSDFVLATYTFDWKGDDSNKLTVKIKIEDAEGTVLKENNGSGISQMVTVTIDGVKFTLKKGDTLASLTSGYEARLLKSLKESKDDEEFIGFYKEDGTEVKETDKIDADTVLTAKFKTIEKATTTETKKEDKKDTTPQTGVVDYSVYMAIATAVVALGGIFTVKKLVR